MDAKALNEQYLMQVIDSISPENDVLVCIMGPGGPEKSTFVDVMAGPFQDDQILTDPRSGVHLHKCLRHATGRPYAFLEVPGFMDDRRMDLQIFREVAYLFENLYKKGTRVAAMVYLQPVAEYRTSGGTSRHLDMFGKLCGSLAARSVALTTTGWDIADQTLCETRERQLKEKPWKPLLGHGASLHRFRPTRDSAWAIVDAVAANEPSPPLLIQEELVDLKLGLWQTHAGSNIYQTLYHVLQQQREALEQLREAARPNTDPQVLEDFLLKQKELEGTVRATSEELDRMKVSFGRRLLARLSLKRPKARPLKMAK